MFVKDHWYPVAWDHEIGATPLGRTICGEPIVFWRRPDRSVAALEDMCPHRMLPLSEGCVVGGNLQCGYHGIVVDATGDGVSVPGAGTVPDWVSVPSYLVEERHRFVWVWIGEASKADPGLIPDFSFCTDPDWAFDGGIYNVKANYRLMVDNLMDLTHETYVHAASIGQEELTESPIEVTSDDDSVTVTRWMKGVVPPPFWANNLKSTAPCDRWQVCRFTLPANVMIDVGVALTGTGAPEGDRSQGVSAIVFDMMTPETDSSHWYFWGFARDFEVGDTGLTSRIKAAQGQIFMEDVSVLEAQQATMERNPDRFLANLPIDEGGRRARRLIERIANAANAEQAITQAAE